MPLPSTETNLLDLLSGQNLLSGVPPVVLEGIDVAESSGQGGGLNPQGYGGFFGLGAGKSYPGGYTIPASELTDPSAASFVPQAEAAGAEFASLLAAHGGDVYAAEAAYQGGGSEGTDVFSAMGVPRFVAPGAITPADTAAGYNASLAPQLGATPAATGSSSSGGATIQTASWWNPFSWGTAIGKDIARVAALATFTAGGLALVVLGVDRASGGRIHQGAEGVARTGAEVGAVAAA